MPTQTEIEWLDDADQSGGPLHAILTNTSKSTALADGTLKTAVEQLETLRPQILEALQMIDDVKGALQDIQTIDPRLYSELTAPHND